MNSAEIPRAGATVLQSIAVQQFAPVSAMRHTDAITKPWDGSEVANDENGILWVLAFAQKGNRAGEIVIAIHPLKPSGIGIKHVQGGLVAIESVQLCNPLLHAAVQGILQHVPL